MCACKIIKNCLFYVTKACMATVGRGGGGGGGGRHPGRRVQGGTQSAQKRKATPISLPTPPPGRPPAGRPRPGGDAPLTPGRRVDRQPSPTAPSALGRPGGGHQLAHALRNVMDRLAQRGQRGHAVPDQVDGGQGQGATFGREGPEVVPGEERGRGLLGWRGRGRRRGRRHAEGERPPVLQKRNGGGRSRCAALPGRGRAPACPPADALHFHKDGGRFTQRRLVPGMKGGGGGGGWRGGQGDRHSGAKGRSCEGF